MAPLGTSWRLAGMMLGAPKRCQMYWWLASESNSASANTKRSGGPLAGRVQQPRQRPGVAPRPLPGLLRQQNLLLHIHHDQPPWPQRRRKRRTVRSVRRSTVSSSNRRRKRSKESRAALQLAAAPGYTTLGARASALGFAKGPVFISASGRAPPATAAG